MASLETIIDLLDKSSQLRPPDANYPWPILDPGLEVVELDWARLFPRRPVDRGFEDWSLFDDTGWEVPEETLARIAQGPDGGADSPAGRDGADPPGWDRCAWYQPIHFFGAGWGIFLHDECIINVAAQLYTRLGRPSLTPVLAQTLCRAGFAALFLHEQYHHKTESLAIRLHVVERRPCYRDYFRKVYVPSIGTDDQLEEGLANADSFLRLTDEPYNIWLIGQVRRVTKAYLKDSFRSAPPGYRLAAGLLNRPTFDAEECLLKARVQEGALLPGRSSIEFDIATYLNQSLLSIRQNIWVVVAKGNKAMLPVNPSWVFPLSRRDLEKSLRGDGWTVAPGRGEGSHHRYEKPGAVPVHLPDVKDLSPVVLRNTAHALGLRNVNDLKAWVSAS
jgi:predicted RNA binding protein YcfA (HicA-like mRNA interferase family)